MGYTYAMGNWVDLTIIVVLLYYLVSGWQTGLIYLGESLVSYLISLWLALRYHGVVGDFIGEKVGVAPVWATVLGYVVVAGISQLILGEVGNFLTSKIPKTAHHSKTNTWLGAIVSLLNGFIVIAFVLIVLLVLPLKGTLKKDIRDSRVASALVQLSQRYGGEVANELDDATRKAITFFTIEPASSERVSLDVSVTEKDISVDAVSEEILLAKVNQERSRAGVSNLVPDEDLRYLAREYSRDMFLRKYFSHINPEGENVGDRMKNRGLSYQVVGENLAYAPDVDTAHIGLMNSPGHKRNILDPSFRKIGIGAIDGGIYGKMFTQIFVKE
jgi:uncharacterized protein YkwD